VAERKLERKTPAAVNFSYAHTPPYRRGFEIRIAARQQQLRLMRTQVSACFRARWPPAEATLGQARRPSTSIAHCATAAASGAINSINDGDVDFFATPSAAIISRFSLP